MDFSRYLDTSISVIKKNNLWRERRVFSTGQGRTMRLNDREVLNFSSNNYLCLAQHPELIKAACEATGRYGTGTGASRLISGTLTIHKELESAIAAFKGKEAAVLFSSGYVANVAAISALAGGDDVVIIDKLSHASIIDGTRLSPATVRIYKHGDIEDLESILKKCHSYRNRWIITDTVFSMDGDRAPLREIVNLSERYSAYVMIDEAHATGVIGPCGRGLAHQCRCTDRIQVIMGTLSKAIGSMGGYITGEKALCDLLYNKARGFIYSTALSPAPAAAAIKGIELAKHSDDKREHLKKLLENLSERKEWKSAIFTVMIGDEAETVKLSAKLFEQNIFIPAIRYPTVAKGKARLRISLTADHTESDIIALKKLLTAVHPLKPRNSGLLK